MTRSPLLAQFSVLAILLACGLPTLAQAPNFTHYNSLDEVLNTNQNSFLGAVPQGDTAISPTALSLQDALDRGLKFNLGLLLAEKDTHRASAERLLAISEMFPQVYGQIAEEVQKINLRALGLGAIPGIPNSVGPFSTNDVRGVMTWSIFDVANVENTRSKSQLLKASHATYHQARETVVLAVGASYLLTIADESRLAAAQANAETADALYRLAEDQRKAGLVAEIDALRARVELQNRKHALSQAQNDLEKQRAALARLLGFSITHQLVLTDRVQYQPLGELTEKKVLDEALRSRPDVLAAQSQLQASELAKRAARAEYLPSLNFSGDYGVLGMHPSAVSPSWTATGTLHIPIFQGGKVQADVREADAILQQQRARVADLRGRIAQETHDAILDVNSAAEQVETSKIGCEYARDALNQAKDRFAAGLTNNIEVIQAQQAFANAQDQYIASVYEHNIAKVLLARTTGTAEPSIKRYLLGASQPASQTATPDAQPVPEPKK